jgi:hypothetical protein
MKMFKCIALVFVHISLFPASTSSWQAAKDLASLPAIVRDVKPSIDRVIVLAEGDKPILNRFAAIGEHAVANTTGMGKEIRDTAHAVSGEMQGLTMAVRQEAQHLLVTTGDQMARSVAGVGHELRSSIDYATSRYDKVFVYHTKGVALTGTSLFGVIIGLIFLKNGIDRLIMSDEDSDDSDIDIDHESMRRQGYRYTIAGGAFLGISLLIMNKSDAIARFFTAL